MQFGFWKNRKHNLARMDLKDLLVAYATYPAVLIYSLCAIIALALAFTLPYSPHSLAFAGIVTIFVYPLVWYLLHRFVLHGQFLYRSALTAKVWKRIHFDHHQDPHNLVVLFGALYTTLPTIAIVTLPIGWAIGGSSAAAMAFGTGVAWTCFYEFCHCVQHLNTTPRSPFLKRIKQLHLAHHFHNEQGNYGITNYFWDRIFRSYYAKASLRPKSPTVFNIGYTEEMAKIYPWVADLSQGTRGDENPRRFRVS